MKNYILIITGLVLALVSCTPVRNLSITMPTSRVADYRDGAPVQADSANGVVIRMNYEGYTDAGLVYSVECINRSDAPFTLYPAGFTMQGITSKQKAKGATTEVRTVRAYSFSKGLNAMDSTVQNQKDRITFKRVAIAVAVVAAVATTAYLAAPPSSNSSRSRGYCDPNGRLYGSGFSYGYLGYYHPIYWSGHGSQPKTESKSKARLHALEGHRDNFKANGLQMTGLAPGESVSGQILIPRMDKATSLRLQYAVGDSVLSFEYQQAILPKEDI